MSDEGGEFKTVEPNPFTGDAISRIVNAKRPEMSPEQTAMIAESSALKFDEIATIYRSFVPYKKSAMDPNFTFEDRDDRDQLIGTVETELSQNTEELDIYYHPRYGLETDEILIHQSPRDIKKRGRGGRYIEVNNGIIDATLQDKINSYIAVHPEAKKNLRTYYFFDANAGMLKKSEYPRVIDDSTFVYDPEGDEAEQITVVSLLYKGEEEHIGSLLERVELAGKRYIKNQSNNK